MISGRALHFVFKVADRALTAKFYRDILGMKVRKNNANKRLSGFLALRIIMPKHDQER